LYKGTWQGYRSSVKAKRMIRSLLTEGFTKQEIARRMGKAKFLKVKKKMQYRTEARFEAFYNYYVKEAA
jgi:hypothetical protein